MLILSSISFFHFENVFFNIFFCKIFFIFFSLIFNILFNSSSFKYVFLFEIGNNKGGIDILFFVLIDEISIFFILSFKSFFIGSSNSFV